MEVQREHRNDRNTEQLVSLGVTARYRLTVSWPVEMEHLEDFVDFIVLTLILSLGVEQKKVHVLIQIIIWFKVVKKHFVNHVNV